MSDLPPGWTICHLPDVASIALGKMLDAKRTAGESMPYLRNVNVRWGVIELHDLLEMPFQEHELERFGIQDGDILVCEGGEPGRAAVWRGGPTTIKYQKALHRVRPEPQALDPQWVVFHLRHDAGGKLSTYFSGTTIKHLTGVSFATYPLLLAPLNEQRRIVAKIEALTARSRAAREALEQVPPLLERFRQSVLAAAFRGDLTAEWRRQHPHVEPGWHRPLLEAERKSLGLDAGARRKGNFWGSGDTTGGVRPEWGNVPGTWEWVRVKDLGFDPSTVVQIGPMSMKSNEFTDHGTTVLNVGCVQWGELDLSKANYLPPERAADFERYRVSANDVMFTRSGTVGRSAIVPAEVAGSLMTFHLLRVRVAPTVCDPRYLFLAFQGCPGVLSQVNETAIGATRAGFNTRLLEEMLLPLAPPEEQAAIVSLVEQRLSALSVVHASLGEAVGRLRDLDQAILAKAFRGELVAQDPSDEPATVLLERIRAEREAAGISGGRRGRRGRANEAEPTDEEDESEDAPAPAHASGTNGNGSTLHAVLGAIKREALHRIADAEGVELADRRTLDAAREGVIGGGVTLEAALEHLDRDELKAVCRSLGLNDRGKTKDELRERVIEAVRHAD